MPGRRPRPRPACRRAGPPLGLGLLALAVALAGCTSTARPQRQDDPTVALVVTNKKLNFAQEIAYGFDSGARRVGGVRASVTGPDVVDGMRELALFRSAMSNAPGGISLCSLSPELFVEEVDAASDQGIPLIAVDNPPPAGSQIRLFIGNDNYELGRLLARQVIARLPADATGTVVVGTAAPGVRLLDHRIEGIRDQLHALLPGVRVLGPFDTKNEPEANLAAWRVLTRANPDALAFLGTGDADGWHLAQIRQETGGRWLAGAYDLDPRALRAVQSGDLLLVSPEHFVKGALAGWLQADRARHGTALPKGWLYTTGLAVTPENVVDIIARQATPASRAAWFADRVEQMARHPDRYLRPLSQAA